MNVLIACEESQTVCKAFRARGHRAFSCDIQECSGGHPEWHIKGDVLPILNGKCEFVTEDGSFHKQNEKWDLIIAHPPCTYLTKAGACRLYRIFNGERFISERRLEQMKHARDFFFRILNADCDRIAIENPTPMKICELPPASQIIQPYMFGHPYSKRTLLWLKGLPQLWGTMIEEDFDPFLPSNTGGVSRGQSFSNGVAHLGIDRAKTFQGVADAMASQWG